MPPLHHAAVCTSDLAHARRFWQEGLGLVEFFDHEIVGDWSTLVGASTDRLRSAFLGGPGHPESRIGELVAFERTDPAYAATTGPRPGFFLLSFNVDGEA